MDYQYNDISGANYQGRNQASLQEAKKENKYESNAWVTFIQAKGKNLKIKKGQKGTSIFKGFVSYTEKDEEDGKRKTYSRPAGFATVFNLDQTEETKKEEINE